MDATDSVSRLHVFAVRAAVAQAPQEMQLVEYQRLSDLAEAGVVKQIHEVGLRRTLQLQLVVDSIDQTLREVPQLDQRTLGVAVSVMLRVAAHHGELGVHRAQLPKVQRSKILHPHLTGTRVGHSGLATEIRTPC